MPYKPTGNKAGRKPGPNPRPRRPSEVGANQPPPRQAACRCCGDWISYGYAHCDMCWQGLIDYFYLAERGIRGGCNPRQHHGGPPELGSLGGPPGYSAVSRPR